MPRFHSPNRKITLGINGERFTVDVFERLIGKTRLKKGWYKINHHRWDSHYNYGTGVDVQIEKDDKPFVDVEVKNWKNQPRTYGVETARSEIINRFIWSNAPIKICFISFLSLLSQKAQQLIRNWGIYLIPIGNWIVKATWKTALKHFMSNHYYRLRYYLQLKPLPKRASHTNSSSFNQPNKYNSLDTHALNNYERIRYQHSDEEGDREINKRFAVNDLSGYT